MTSGETVGNEEMSALPRIHLASACAVRHDGAAPDAFAERQIWRSKRSSSRPCRCCPCRAVTTKKCQKVEKGLEYKGK